MCQTAVCTQGPLRPQNGERRLHQPGVLWLSAAHSEGTKGSFLSVLTFCEGKVPLGPVLTCPAGSR